MILFGSLVRPEFVMAQYMKLYDNTQSELTKLNILQQLSKILSMINTQPQVNVQNNIPQTPVIIKFDDEK